MLLSKHFHQQKCSKPQRTTVTLSLPLGIPVRRLPAWTASYPTPTLPWQGQIDQITLSQLEGYFYKLNVATTTSTASWFWTPQVSIQTRSHLARSLRMATTTLIDDVDPSISYTGGPWEQSGYPGEYMGTTTFSTHKGATASLTFAGEVLYFFSGVDH